MSVSGGLDIGRLLVAPTLRTWGTDDQLARFLPGIEDRTEGWCQLFSEPGAGSDLASLSTGAVLHDGPDGGIWRITGQKVWSTLAHVAGRGILLARTDPDAPKHAGITCFALDMHQPGVTVRPLRQITGRSDEFNEVFLDDAIVTDSDRIGPRSAGWMVSQTTLTSERDMLSRRPREQRGRAEELISVARASGRLGDPVLRNALVELFTRERVTNLTTQRVSDERLAGGKPVAAAVTKLARTTLARRTEDIAMEIHGANATAWTNETSEAAVAVDRFLRAQRETIVGGTSDIQRTVIGDRALGLPREPAVDRDLPWSNTRR
jgi:3-oxochol-4-en-24-oyl-CoA dehydrogenase